MWPMLLCSPLLSPAVLSSTLAAVSLSPLLTCPNATICLGSLIGAFCGMCTSALSMITLLHPLVSSSVSISSALCELGLHFHLTHSDLFFASFVAASVLTPTLCVHMCTWGVHVVSKVVWVVWVLSCSLIGKFSSFFFLQCLLTIYSMFSVISVPISMLGMTLFLLNTFACPHSPQHHISHPQYADNMCPHHCFSAVWHLWSVHQLSLEWSALPFDPSIPFPGPSVSPACSLMPPRHMCMLVSLTRVLTAAL